MNLVSPLERQPSSRSDFRPSEECLGLSASLGIRLRVCPLSDMSCVRPLPDDIAVAVRPVAAKRLTCSALVVSHHPDGLLRTQASGLLHPETGWSSLRFSILPPSITQPKLIDWW